MTVKILCRIYEKHKYEKNYLKNLKKRYDKKSFTKFEFIIIFV